MIYRHRSTALHASGPGAAMAWCGALILAVLLSRDAAVLGLVALTVLAAGRAAQVQSALRRALRGALILALTILVINALVSQDGQTIIWHFGHLPLLGYRYVTAQAVGTGALLGLRAATLVLIGVLYSSAVDPDAVLTLARRVSFRSALTASIATRMVPLLVRDSQRLADAQRTRSGPAPGRVALLQAATSGMLDRTLDVAAALEVRGFGLPSARRAAPRLRTRHDLAFGAAALIIVAAALSAALSTPWLGALIPLAALAPFLDRRGVG